MKNIINTIKHAITFHSVFAHKRNEKTARFKELLLRNKQINHSTIMYCGINLTYAKKISHATAMDDFQYGMESMCNHSTNNVLCVQQLNNLLKKTYFRKNYFELNIYVVLRPACDTDS